jgi:hypothetical protein
MNLNLITLATVKAELGITDTTYDTALTAAIPKVSSDVRRILNNPFSRPVVAAFSSDAATIDLSLGRIRRYYDPFTDIMDLGRMGQVVVHSNIPDDTYIQSYDLSTGLFTLNNTPTGSGDYVFLSVNISQWAAIAKMCWYAYQQKNITNVGAKNVKSETYGPVSVSYADSEINAQWNYPQKLINDLGTPYARTG